MGMMPASKVAGTGPTGADGGVVVVGADVVVGAGSVVVVVGVVVVGSAVGSAEPAQAAAMSATVSAAGHCLGFGVTAGSVRRGAG
jgi:hypothetical protein